MMLNHLKKLLWIVRGGRRVDIYHPGERLLFRYFDGERTVQGDPLVLFRRYASKAIELGIAVKLSRSIHSDAPKGHAETQEIIRDIFFIKKPPEGNPADCGGCLTEVETVDLLERFLEYCDGVKKNMSQTPISAAATSPIIAPSPAAASPTSSISDSGSTASGPPTGPPGPSPTASESPSAS